MKLKYIYSTPNNLSTLKSVISNHFHISTRLFNKLKRNNAIYLNGTAITKNFNNINLKDGDIVEIDLSIEEDNSNIIPQNKKLNILYEDDFLLIVSKDPNMPVHPSLNHFNDSLSNMVKYYFDSIGLHKKIRPVTRLDKETSGICVFAKSEYAQEMLKYQMDNNIFNKYYLAILDGYLNNKTGTINAPIDRKDGSIIEREINPNGKPSISKYTVIKEHNNLSLVEFKLLTGRTHQIRVHSKYIGHPIIGDTLYNTKSDLINRCALHCYKICFNSILDNKPIVITDNLKDDMLIL